MIRRGGEVPTRKLVLAILAAAKEKGKRKPSQGQIARTLRMTQQAISYHMKKIREGV